MSFVKAYGEEGVDGYIGRIYKMVGHAARYGHQQHSEIMNLTFDELILFNDAVTGWIIKENSSTRE